MLRVVVAFCFAGLIGNAALAAPSAQDSATESPAQAYASALRQSIGAPARADLDGQATVRLPEGTLIVPHDVAVRLLTATGQSIPKDFVALLFGSEGVETPGMIRFVPAGFIDSDAALGWTADDILASLREAVESGNPERLKNNLQEREVRRWVRPPLYNPETHQLSWAALILPKSAPRESDGEVTYRAVGFGREGYIELSLVTSEQKAAEIGKVTDGFLTGLNFVPGKAYTDDQPGDRRSAEGLAGAMGLTSLHKADKSSGLLGPDAIVPIIGSIVAAIGGVALCLYILKNMRREARRG